MSYIKVFGPDGQELRWSEDAHKRIVGGYVVVADVECREADELFRKFGGDFFDGCAFPESGGACGGSGKALDAIRGLLDAVHASGAISDGECRRMDEGLADDAARKEMFEKAQLHGFWMSAVKGGAYRFRSAGIDEFDPERHGIAWRDLAAMKDAPSMAIGGSRYPDPGKREICGKALEDALAEMNRAGRGPWYAVHAAEARELGDGTWEAREGFRRIGDGIGSGAIGNVMRKLTEEKVAKRLRECAA